MLVGETEVRRLARRANGRDLGPSHVAPVVSECASNWFRPEGACSGFFRPTVGHLKNGGHLCTCFMPMHMMPRLVLAQATEVG